jgi:glycosyltransferase involved in cell wall biosynthesis
MAGPLEVRNAFADFAHVESEEMFASSGSGAGLAPFLTIAIPTHKRPDLLAEAVRSALAQAFDRPFEVVVVDDDPQSTGHEQLLSDAPEIAGANFRYLRNRQNLGDFGNHSRCVEVARGEWVTILHDDDLLDRTFLREMFRQIDSDERIDGLMCRQRPLDCRPTPWRQSRRRALARKLIEIATFGPAPVRRLTARHLFWGCPRNVVGFVFRKRDAESLGGFYSEDFPSGDYYFYARFTGRFRLYEHRKVLATIRLARNISMRRETQLLGLRRNFDLRAAYAGSQVPRWWGALSPLILASHAALQSRFWRSGLSGNEVGQYVGIAVPRNRPLLLYAIRALLRGF